MLSRKRAEEDVNEFERSTFPSFEEGDAAPYKQMSRYLNQGAAGEVNVLSQQVFDHDRPISLIPLKTGAHRAPLQLGNLFTPA